jgi:hypothetical protein
MNNSIKKTLRTLAGMLWAACACMGATAQTAAELTQKWPGEDVVFLRRSDKVKISLKNGQPAARSTSVTEFMALTDNAARYMGRQSVYHSTFDQLKDWSAYTITTEGKKMKVTDFKTASSPSENVFYDDVQETSFNMPALSIGARAVIEEETEHTNPYLMTPFYYDRYFPTLQAELVVTFPEEVAMKYVIKGLHKDEIRFTEEKKRGQTTWTFAATGYKGEKSYPDAPGRAWWATHVIFYIEKFKKDDGEWQDYLSDTRSLYRFNYNHIKNINRETPPELKRITDSLVTGITDPAEKARRIYRWAQDHIKYVAFEEGLEGFVPREAGLVCNRRFGDCKDFSSILTVMCRMAGVKAYYTWIGTRHLPYDYTDVPLPIVDNHMICAIEINGRHIFLDGTDPSCVFGTPPEGIQDKQAMIAIDENNFLIERVPITPAQQNTLHDTTFLELTDKGMKGRISMNLRGYFANSMYNSLRYYNDKDRDEYFKKRLNRASNKINLSNFNYATHPDMDRISVTADLLLPDYAKKVGDEWFLNLNLFKYYENAEIDYPKRKIPIAHDFKYQATYVTVLDLPENLKVSYLPSSSQYHNSTWGFEINYEQKNRRIIFTQKLNNQHLLLQPGEFENWNKVLEQMFPLYKETVLISKK